MKWLKKQVLLSQQSPKLKKGWVGSNGTLFGVDDRHWAVFNGSCMGGFFSG